MYNNSTWHAINTGYINATKDTSWCLVSTTSVNPTLNCINNDNDNNNNNNNNNNNYPGGAYVPCMYRMPGGVIVPVQCVTSVVGAKLLPVVC